MLQSFLLLIAYGLCSIDAKPEWSASVNLTKWYTALDLCIINNSSRVSIDIIIDNCQKQTGISPSKQPHRCTVGNAWRGPSKAPFCSSEDLAYSDRTHFKNAIVGFDDPSQAPLKELFLKLKARNGALLLIGDSVQQQFMGAMACELEREGVWPDPRQFWNTDETKYVSISSADDKIVDSKSVKKEGVPIKFAAIYHLVNGRYDRLPNASMHAMKTAVSNFVDNYDTVVIVINMGLHYVHSPLVTHFSRADYISQMTTALSYLNSVAQEQINKNSGKEIIILFRETTAQHFATPNGCKYPWWGSYS